MTRGDHGLVGLGPEESAVAIVDLAERYACRIKAEHHTRIDAEDHARLGVHRLHVGRAAAGLAMMEGNRPVAP